MSATEFDTMPDFVQHSRLFRHNVHSAVASLSARGIPLDQVVLRYRAGGEAGAVLGQQPAPGAALARARQIVLEIGGTGTFYSLPFALRDSALSDEFAAEELVGVLDTAIARARVFVQQGGGHFLLQPGVPVTARRWISEVMRVSESPWNRSEWYRVARLLSALPTLAGRHDAVAAALRFVHGLPVSETRVITAVLPLAQQLTSRLGTTNGRLGVDAVIGSGVATAHRLRVSIGPVSLRVYLEEFPRLAARLALYRLVLPAFLPGGVEERWVVERRAEGYRLHARDTPAVLGVSAYLSQIGPSLSPAES